MKSAVNPQVAWLDQEQNQDTLALRTCLPLKNINKPSHGSAMAKTRYDQGSRDHYRIDSSPYGHGVTRRRSQ